MPNSADNSVDINELNDQMIVRREKLADLAAMGIEPYGGAYRVTHYAEQIHERFTELEGESVRVAGRLMAKRGHGKAGFADLVDASGKVQLHTRIDVVGEELYEVYRKLDIGDIIGVEGVVFRTRRGEMTIETRSFTLLTKSLRPLPEKWHGLRDVEQRYRKRYLDLLVNPQVRQVFVTRSRIITAIREFLTARGFLEVETPVLHPIPGGANARPFITHHNALDMDLYLRIAPELYLKRLLVGGLDKVFEIGKNFRNEGISTKHNPEYTSIEIYEAYSDDEGMMALTEQLFAFVAERVVGSLQINFQGEEVDLTPPWPRLTMMQALQNYAGVSPEELTDDESAVRLAKQHGLELEPADRNRGKVLEKLFDRYVEPKLVQPVFITQHPVEISPLAKRNPKDPGYVNRFEPYIVTWEMANGFAELNDPMDQRRRFEEQLRLRELGDQEAQYMDEDFLEALEYGMPPAGGLGIGIDRMVMLFTDSPSIREVILFPHMRPAE